MNLASLSLYLLKEHRTYYLAVISCEIFIDVVSVQIVIGLLSIFYVFRKKMLPG